MRWQFYFLFLCIGLSLMAAQVVESSSLSVPNGIGVMPDVMGKVLAGNLSHNYQTNPTRNAVVWPNYPLNLSGYTYEGGVLCNMDDDTDLEILHGFSSSVRAFNSDGSVVPGWPQTITYLASGAPAVGDIDGDGIDEIVVTSHNIGSQNNGMLYAFEKDGTSLTGFPVTMPGGGTNSPALRDINGDGCAEILVAARHHPSGYMCVYDHTGAAVTGWPVTLDYVPGSPASAADLNGDGTPEILVESYYSLYVFNADGATRAGFPYTPGGSWVTSYSTPMIADLDSDDVPEILFGIHNSDDGTGRMVALHADGTLVTGWPQDTPNWIFTPPAVGDIDGDGELEICAGENVTSTEPSCNLYAWNADGTLVNGFPVTPVWAIYSQIMLVDIDNDNLPELITDNNTSDGVYPAYNGNGTTVTGWNATVTGSTMFQTPTFGDVNNDGVMDMIGTGLNLETGNSTLYLYNLNTPVNASANPLSVLQYNIAHTGVYATPATPPDEHQLGDVNDDDAIDSEDVQAAIDYANGLDPLSEDPRPWEDWRLEMADVDGNGVIQAFDAAEIQRRMAGIITEFPVEDPGFVPPVGSLTLQYTPYDLQIQLVGAGSLFALQIGTNTMIGDGAVIGMPEYTQTGVFQSDNAVNDSLNFSVCSATPLSGFFGSIELGYPVRNNRTSYPHEFHLTVNDVESDVTIDIEGGVSTDDQTLHPESLTLPNPYRPGMLLQLAVKQNNAPVRADLYNLRGQKVRTLINEPLPNGVRLLSWNGLTDHGSRAGNGVYLLRVQSGDQSQTKKLVFIR
jgi:hypothetical protein